MTDTPDLQALSAEELIAHNTDLGNAINAIRDQQLLVHAELSRREALKKFHAMSETEKAAVTQYVNAHGIAATSQVSSIGG